ncbi:DSD1 family PLP-dependent enzyme [Hahella sp. NBU794]|uniref:DSD1 family PLP-dependent enzyme n=1 Tax=Hahella sp. NBU794 TaxID=3422590 RepID=UPI003D6F8C4C
MRLVVNEQPQRENFVNATPTPTESLNTIDTPFLAVDKTRFQANISRMRAYLQPFKVRLRPHLKTVKSVPAAELVMASKQDPATVSTLKEAEAFAEAGYTDLLYAVGISPQKLPRVLALQRTGVNISILLDSREQAEMVIAFCRENDANIPVYIEVDCDGHRAGLPADDPELVAIGRLLHEADVEVRGVMSHSGGAYDCDTPEQLATAAEQERRAAVAAAQALRNAGVACPEVSVGSTPAALSYTHLEGVTEVRAGVYTFFDLVMAGIGVCKLNDIALSVVTTVTGHNKAKGWLFVDAGWSALSRDRGTAEQKVDQLYGVVCDEQGRVIDGLLVSAVNQEHGVLSMREGGSMREGCREALPELPIGTRLRILPNHACATAGQFLHYHVLDGANQLLAIWPRIQGW